MFFIPNKKYNRGSIKLAKVSPKNKEDEQEKKIFKVISSF